MFIKLLTGTIDSVILAGLELTGDDVNLIYSDANARLMRAVKDQRKI